jgi:hypothetical protein
MIGAIATARVIADSRAGDGGSPVRDHERPHPGCDGAAHCGVAGTGRDGCVSSSLSAVCASPARLYCDKCLASSVLQGTRTGEGHDEVRVFLQLHQ